MSAAGNNNNGGRKVSLRAMIDFVMGAVYIILAGVVAYSRHFGTLELSPGIVWGMGGLLVVYGTFRIYLGINKYKNGE